MHIVLVLLLLIRWFPNKLEVNALKLSLMLKKQQTSILQSINILFQILGYQRAHLMIPLTLTWHVVGMHIVAFTIYLFCTLTYDIK